MPGTLTKNEPATKTKPESAGSLLPIQEFPFFLSQLRDEFDRMFDRFVSGLPEMAFPSTNRWRWGMEVKDEDTAIVIRAEAPGFEPNDIEVQVQDGQLSVRAVRKIEKKEAIGRKCNGKSFIT